MVATARPAMSVVSRPSAPQLVLAYGGLFGAAVFWGSFFPLMELLLQSWDPLSLNAGRVVLGALLLLLILHLREGRGALAGRVPWGRVWLLGGIGIAAFTMLLTFAVATSGGVPVAIISTTTPIIAAFMARAVYGISLGRGTAVGAVLAVVGGLCAVLGGAAGKLTDIRGGEVLMLVALMLWTWFSLAAQRWLKGCSQLRIAALTMTTGAVCLVGTVAVMAVAGLNPVKANLSSASLALVVYLAATSVALGNVFWHFGVSRVGLTVASMHVNLIPVVAVVIAIWFGSYPTALQLLGGALVIAGVLYAQIKSRPSEAMREAPLR